MIQPIRILYFTSFFAAQGGASHSFLKLLENFNRDEFKAFAVLPRAIRHEIARMELYPEIKSRITFVNIDRISRQIIHPLRFLQFCRRAANGILEIRRLLRTWQIDVVHANDLRDFHAPVAAKLCGIPVAWHLRACRPNPLTRYPIAAMMHLIATKIVAVSHSAARQMLLHKSFAQHKVAVIHNPGPYRDRFHPGVDGSAIRDEFSIPAKAPVITTIGKLTQRKGQLVLIKALPLILEKFPDARFLIVGGELEGHAAYAHKLRSLGRDYVKSGHLIFAGERSDVPEIMAASDIIVQPSLCQDAFPGVVLEAMAVGRVVVACEAGGTPEQITPGEDGVLFKMGDHRDLAGKIVGLLSNEKRMLRLRETAIINLERKFNFEKFKNELTALYANLCHRRQLPNDPAPKGRYKTNRNDERRKFQTADHRP